jgi:hypothetical protein
MASPIIDSVTPAGPLTLTPGQAVTFNVAAHDPDTKSGAATITVTDSANNATQVQVALTVNDPLTYSAVTNVGTVTQSATNPTQFVLQV